jgi:nitric oxide reductase activation protein
MVFLTVCPGVPSSGQGAQQLPGQNTIPGPPGRRSIPPDGDSLPPRMAEQQAQARNNERQKKLIEDTNKLLELATELKAQVDKTNKDTLSVDVIKKADEIEKLAHSVKERMKG